MKTAFALPVIGLLFLASQAMAGPQGWDAARNVDHPLELLSIPAISRAADTLLGDDRENFVASLEGAGSGDFDDGFYIGSACMPNVCTVAESFIAADIANGRLYLAWKPEDEDIIVRPAVGLWPGRVRSALAEWAATWKQ